MPPLLLLALMALLTGCTPAHSDPASVGSDMGALAASAAMLVVGAFLVSMAGFVVALKPGLGKILRFILPALAPLALLGGCAAPVPSASCIIQPIPYAKASQDKAAAETEALPAQAELRRYMDDYGAERAALRKLCP